MPILCMWMWATVHTPCCVSIHVKCNPPVFVFKGRYNNIGYFGFYEYALFTLFESKFKLNIYPVNILAYYAVSLTRK